MTWYRTGYVDGLHTNAQRYLFRTKKAERLYNRGYAKGLGTLYFRILMEQTSA